MSACAERGHPARDGERCRRAPDGTDPLSDSCVRRAERDARGAGRVAERWGSQASIDRLAIHIPGSRSTPIQRSHVTSASCSAWQACRQAQLTYSSPGCDLPSSPSRNERRRSSLLLPAYQWQLMTHLGPAAVRGDGVPPGREGGSGAHLPAPSPEPCPPSRSTRRTGQPAATPRCRAAPLRAGSSTWPSPPTSSRRRYVRTPPGRSA